MCALESHPFRHLEGSLGRDMGTWSSGHSYPVRSQGSLSSHMQQSASEHPTHHTFCLCDLLAPVICTFRLLYASPHPLQRISNYGDLILLEWSELSDMHSRSIRWFCVTVGRHCECLRVK